MCKIYEYEKPNTEYVQIYKLILIPVFFILFKGVNHELSKEDKESCYGNLKWKSKGRTDALW